MNYMEGSGAQLVYAPLWWHEKGLQQTSSGYGKKLTTPWKAQHDGRLYRVYCVCFSNIGTLYILPKGEPLYIDTSVTPVSTNTKTTEE